MKLREVDPLEPQPGDLVRIYTPTHEDPDHAMNWDEGVVKTNSFEGIVLHRSVGRAGYYDHAISEALGSIYYIVEEA